MFETVATSRVAANPVRRSMRRMSRCGTERDFSKEQRTAMVWYSAMQGSTEPTAAERSELPQNPEQRAPIMKPRKRHYVLAALILLALLGSIAHCRFGYSHPDFSGHAWGCDDAYIAYRYAV